MPFPSAAARPTGARLPADQGSAVLGFVSPLLTRNDVDPVVRVIAGRARPRGLHAEFGRQVRAVLPLELRASPQADYELGAHALVARVVHDLYWPTGNQIVLPVGVAPTDIEPVRPVRGATELGTLRPAACTRLGASAHRAARFEDVVAFWRDGNVFRVAMHCPLPGQSGHKIRLSETPAGQFRVPTGADEMTGFAVPWQVALVLRHLGPPVVVSLTGDGHVQFVGHHGVAIAPLVALGTP